LLERLPNLWPENDLLSNIVFAANPQNVSDVIINGQIVMQDRKITTINEYDAIKAAKESILRLG
jgi:5-methylthioadenosine/S-adenosylhomocysteine deaminase